MSWATGLILCVMSPLALIGLACWLYTDQKDTVRGPIMRATWRS